MTPDDRRAHLARILDEHDHIAAHLRESSESLLGATEHLQAIATRLSDSHAAIHQAVAAMIAANRAALGLFNDADSHE